MRVRLHSAHVPVSPKTVHVCVHTCVLVARWAGTYVLVCTQSLAGRWAGK